MTNARDGDISAEEIRRIIRYDPLTGKVYRLIRNGHVLAVPEEIRPTRKGNVSYVYIHLHGHEHSGHRVIWKYMTGEWPVGFVDHINLDGTDNRWANLREATKSQNGANRRIAKHNKIGWKGVRERRGRYRAEITFQGHTHQLGTFDTTAEAHAAYLSAAKRFHGEFARGE
jgi:hypothetical protein